jgi:hypothetical protein
MELIARPDALGGNSGWNSAGASKERSAGFRFCTLVAAGFFGARSRLRLAAEDMLAGGVSAANSQAYQEPPLPARTPRYPRVQWRSDGRGSFAT